MAEAVLVTLATNILSSLIDRQLYLPLEGHPCVRILQLPNLMSNLNKELESLKGFLGDAEERQEEDDEVKRWMSRIKDLVYEVQDITEKHLNRIERHIKQQQQQQQRSIRRCSCNPLNSLLVLRDAMVLAREASRIRSLTSKLSSLTSKMKAYGIESRPVESSRSTADPVLSVADEEEMLIVGRNEDIKAIENQLIYVASTNVIGVCGAHGLGKTTLVREVLRRSTLIEEHFQAVAWAFVGEHLQVRSVLEKILTGLLQSIADENEREQIKADAGSANEEGLSDRIRQILVDKKCLVVLDDFETQDPWNDGALRNALSPILSADSSSKLVLTTSDASVLSFVDCRGYLHQPRCLSTAERWQLFQKKAGKGIQVKGMGRKIVEGPIVGLPLTIHIFGGILADNAHPMHKILGNYYANLAILSVGSRTPIKSRISSPEIVLFFGRSTDEVGIQEVLNLSYRTLSVRIRSCLVEMCVHYPEGHEIQAVELIKLWIDKKIVKNQKQGESCLDQLVRRSLIQVGSKETSTRKIKTCQLHSLVHRFFRDPPPTRVLQNLCQLLLL